MSAIDPDREQLAEGTLVSHLIELRQRVFKALIAIAVVFVCLVPFTQEIFTIVAQPLQAQLPEDWEMISIRPAGPFLTPFMTTLFVAVFIAMPVVLYQVWAFVAPGLYRHEKRFAVPMLSSSIVLFYAGVAFAYYVVFPIMFKFFASMAPEGVMMQTDIGEYLSFVLTLFLAFGVAFEVPIATVMLIWSGLVDIRKLQQARPYVFLGAFVIGMFLTPPDVISQTLMALPMYVLYEAGLLMARLLLPEKVQPKGEEGA